MGWRHMNVVFFIPRIGEGETLEHLLQKAQGTSIRIHSPVKYKRDMAYCMWGEQPCYVYLREFSQHQVLVLCFLEGSLLRLLPSNEEFQHLPQEEDPTLPITLAFREGCKELGAEVAWIESPVYDPELEEKRIEAREFDIITKCSDGLAGEFLNLLYLNEEQSKWLTPNPWRDKGKSDFPCDHGRLIFQGKWPYQWGYGHAEDPT